MSEPDWMRSIPSSSVCDWFFVFFCIYGAILVLTVLGAIGILGSYKLPPGVRFAVGSAYFLLFSITAVNYLFVYIVCDRSLLADKKEGYAVYKPTILQKILPKKR